MALISLHGKHLFSLFLPTRDEVLKSDVNEALPSLYMVKDQIGYRHCVLTMLLVLF